MGTRLGAFEASERRVGPLSLLRRDQQRTTSAVLLIIPSKSAWQPGSSFDGMISASTARSIATTNGLAAYEARDRDDHDPRWTLMHDLDLPRGEERELVVDRDRVYE